MTRIALMALLAGCTSTWSLDDLDGDGITLLEGDCDDGAAEVGPGTAEVCDGVDNDCDGVIDGPDADGAVTWYADEDADGFGNPDRILVTCETPDGFVREGGDCDDSAQNVAPGLPETCDRRDNDCDGDVDEEPSDGITFFEDRDEDGFGSRTRPVIACEAPAGATAEDLAMDCEDDDDTAFPGSRQTEVPGDGVDQDCDGIDACTDFTCDGLPDLIIGTYREDSDTETEVRVFAGTDGRTFADVATERLPSDTVLDLDASDFDADGYLDLVWISGDAEGDGAVSVAFGGPDGLNPTRRLELTAYRPQQLALIDLDRDGDDDLVAASSREEGRWDTSAFVYVNDGAGSFSQTALPVRGAYGVEVADIDDDGWIDVLFCNYRGDGGVGFGVASRIYWSGTGGADFKAERFTDLPGVACGDVELGDADGDGLLDVFIATKRDSDGGAPEHSRIVLNDDDRFTSPDEILLPLAASSSVDVGDVDGDGLDDALFGYDGRVTQVWKAPASLFLTADDGSLSATFDGEDPRNPALGDVDGDGLLDVLVPSFGDFFGTDQTEPTRVFYNRLGGPQDFEPGPVLPTAGSWRVIARDVDQDGANDLLVTNAGEGDRRGAEAAVWFQRDGVFSIEDRWTVRMGKIRTPPVILGRWPDAP